MPPNRFAAIALIAPVAIAVPCACTRGGPGSAPAHSAGGAALAIVSPATAEASGQPTSHGPWAADDQRGSVNRITPGRVAAAAGLITHGRIYTLGRAYEPGMPMFGARHMSLTIPGAPTGGPMGENRIVYHDEMFTGEIGQIGTQFDALCHIAIRDEQGEDVFYNGLKGSDIRTPYGFTKLGVEQVGAIFCRGVLIDVPRFKGVEFLEDGHIITAEELQGAQAAQGIEVREGDAVFIRTAHGRLWMTDNERYIAGEPGPGLTAVKWLIERKIVLVGADNWGVEAVPGENPDRPFECHEWLIQRNGIYNLENLDLETLAADRVWEFAFIFAPVPIKGATGSPGNPIAVR